MLKQYLIFTWARDSISREPKLTNANVRPFDVIAVSIYTAPMHTSYTLSRQYGVYRGVYHFT